MENVTTTTSFNTTNIVNMTWDINENFYIPGYLLGLLLLVSINIGPYMYFKFVKNKKIFNFSGFEPKHTI